MSTPDFGASPPSDLSANNSPPSTVNNFLSNAMPVLPNTPLGSGRITPPSDALHAVNPVVAKGALPTRELAQTVTTMGEVRQAIDRLDEELVSLLAVRLRFIEAAARIKNHQGAVRDEWRKQDVISKAVKKAKEVNFDEKITRDVYESLVEGCIEYEEHRWAEMRGKTYLGKGQGTA